MVHILEHISKWVFLCEPLRSARAFPEPRMYGGAQAADPYEAQRFFEIYIVTHVACFVDADRVVDAEFACRHVHVFSVFRVAEDDAALEFRFDE